MKKRWSKWALVGVAVVLVAVQLVPYGRNHTNPPVISEPPWSDPSVRALAVRACFDCHSNQTAWPWYSHVAPISWVLYRDVKVGRSHLNFSEWDRPQEDAKEAAGEVLDGEMPLGSYRLVHRRDALTANERYALVQGLRLTLGANTPSTQKSRSALERWLAQADAELRVGITRSASMGW